jgi:DNA-binding transcriptional ArsR family regulator
MTMSKYLDERVERTHAKAAADRAAAPASTSRRKPPKGDRWQTLNQFVDVIAPRLTLAERAVWLVAFRHARGGIAELTVRTLAKAAGVSRSTAEASLMRLTEAGLVWIVFRSKDRTRGSRFGIHPSPGDCLGKVLNRPDRRDG